MATLYIETNFVVGAARGQDPDADALLATPRDVLRIALPSICVMETWSRYERLVSNHKQLFDLPVRRYMDELHGDAALPSAEPMMASLRSTFLTKAQLVNETLASFEATLRKLVAGPEGRSRVDLIPLRTDVLASSLASQRLTEEPTDALILEVMKSHAVGHTDETKAFLSANKSDFAAPEVRQSLGHVGITRYFTKTGHALGWFRAGCSA